MSMMPLGPPHLITMKDSPCVFPGCSWQGQAWQEGDHSAPEPLAQLCGQLKDPTGRTLGSILRRERLLNRGLRPHIPTPVCPDAREHPSLNTWSPLWVQKAWCLVSNVLSPQDGAGRG